MKARIPAQFTKNQRQNVRRAIADEWLKRDAEYSMEFDAMLLFVLHEQFGFGKKRLRRYFDACFRLHHELRDKYQFHGQEDMGWLYRRKLAEDAGVDIEDWYREAGIL